MKCFEWMLFSSSHVFWIWGSTQAVAFCSQVFIQRLAFLLDCFLYHFAMSVIGIFRSKTLCSCLGKRKKQVPYQSFHLPAGAKRFMQTLFRLALTKNCRTKTQTLQDKNYKPSTGTTRVRMRNKYSVTQPAMLHHKKRLKSRLLSTEFLQWNQPAWWGV